MRTNTYTHKHTHTHTRTHTHRNNFTVTQLEILGFNIQHFQSIELRICIMCVPTILGKIFWTWVADQQCQYLPSLCKDGICPAEITIRATLAKAAMATLNRIWRCNTNSFASKFKLYKSLVTSILLYGCDTWTLLRNQVPKETSPHLLSGAQDQRLGAEQDQLPCGPTETSSGNWDSVARKKFSPRQIYYGVKLASTAFSPPMLERFLSNTRELLRREVYSPW